MRPCDRSNAFNYADSKLLLRGSEEDFFVCVCVKHSNTSRKQRVGEQHVTSAASFSVFPFCLLLGGREGEKSAKSSTNQAAF